MRIDVWIRMLITFVAVFGAAPSVAVGQEDHPLVSHTDMTGSFGHNRSLSEARARAVVKALVDGYGIAAARLEGHGVGPLAPVASNARVGDRARNRRVELVAR